MSSDTLAHEKELWQLVGAFQVAWSAVEPVIDLAIQQFLLITAEEAHLLITGLELNRKATFLRHLVARSSHEKKGEIISLINRI